MSKKRRILLFVLIPVVLICAVLGFIASRSGHLSVQLPVTRKEQWGSDHAAGFPSRLSAAGNRLVDANGTPVHLKGLMPQDPAVLQQRGKFKRAFFEGMSKTGANVIRIPVHTENWVRDPDYLWRYLDPVVTWAGELGMYVIIDWHGIGNVVTGAGEQMADTKQPSLNLALEFWTANARYFRDAPHVIFEIFNEPESISAMEWKAVAEKLIGVIRAQGAQQLIIAGGLDFGRDLSWVLAQPIAEKNLAYASHIYPSHSVSGWDGWFGKVSETYPVISTEWGYMSFRPDSPTYLVGTRESYGEPFLQYLDAHNIGWVACWYDDEWLPPMFEKGQQQLTSYGQFIMEKLAVKSQ